jgi:hypothetical protein
MFTLEDIINKLEEDVNKLWKSQSEQFKMEKSSSEGHLLLLQLNSYPVYYVSENCFPSNSK